METRIKRLLTLIGFWMITILSVSGQIMPDKLRTETPTRSHSAFISVASSTKTFTHAQVHHLLAANASSHRSVDYAMEQVEEISVKKEDSAPEADRFAQHGFHPRWYFSDPVLSTTTLPSYTKRLANQMAVRTERYILFQDFRI